MTCNAWNHPPDCNCGWGGVFHGFPAPDHLAWPTLPGTFVNPNARCPKCGQQVFFFRSTNGGSVYFEALGRPWPKHPCMASEAVAEIPNSIYWQAVDYLDALILKRIQPKFFLASEEAFLMQLAMLLLGQVASNHYPGVVATWVIVLPRHIVGETPLELAKVNKSQVLTMATSITDKVKAQSRMNLASVCLTTAREVLNREEERKRRDGTTARGQIRGVDSPKATT